MKFSDIPIPEVYMESADFRFFIYWFEECLTKLKYDTENIMDLLDPQRCPKSLLWLLEDTYGFKHDDRFPVSYNRFILLYFMSMIYNRGSKTGLTIAAETNLAQFNIIDYVKEDETYNDRLKDTSIPVNSVYVTPHVDTGYIDVVYYSENIPTDACLEYVRPLGMYCFTHAGVRVDSRTKISVDARLTNINDTTIDIAPTRVGHYRRADYASMQRMVDSEGNPNVQQRQRVWYRNSDFEKKPTQFINPGLRSLSSLQLCNNEHIVKALLPSQKEPDAIFSIGLGPQNVDVTYPDNYLKHADNPAYNLRYDLEAEEALGSAISTLDKSRTRDIMNPNPAINRNMPAIGESISLQADNHVVSTISDVTGRPTKQYIWYEEFPDSDDN